MNSGHLHKPPLQSCLGHLEPQEASAGFMVSLCSFGYSLSVFPAHSLRTGPTASVSAPPRSTVRLGFSNQSQIPAPTWLSTVLTGHSKLSSGLHRHGTYMAHRHTCRQNSYTHKTNRSFFLFVCLKIQNFKMISRIGQYINYVSASWAYPRHVWQWRESTFAAEF